MKTPYELFGIECERGWGSLIYELIQKLKELGWDGDIHQIKEKFGGLRFYVGETTEEMSNLIHEYEEKSYTICEKCGGPGWLRNDLGWIKTYCQKHYEETLDSRYGVHRSDK